MESGNNPDAVGDGGASLGPLQIMRGYWADSRTPGQYEQVRDRQYAERVCVGYWRRYCPQALAAGDWETLARTHNGGPKGATKTATLVYWRRVEAELNRSK